MSPSQAYSIIKSLRCEKRTAMLPDISVHEAALVTGYGSRGSCVVLWVCQLDIEGSVQPRISVLRPLIDFLPSTADPLLKSSLCSRSPLGSFS